MKHYSVVCICQIYNELEKGNLERFAKYVMPLVDGLVVYDDCSTDGSYEYMKKVTPHVIRGAKNDFADEIAHKQQMLERALTLNPDYILWLDADEVLTAHADERLQEACLFCDENKCDGLNLHELNLWRSGTYRRTDSLYDNGWFARLWKASPELAFAVDQKGLHQLQVPPSIKEIKNTEILAVLHYGFATERSLAFKYLTYRQHGQRGYAMLDRLISEETLELVQVPRELFPDGLWVDEEEPRKMTFPESLAYVDTFRGQVTGPKYSIACLIYKSVRWLQFVYEQVLKYTDLKDVEFYFVANDPSDEVVEYLRNNYIPHYIFRNTPEHRQEWYINNVYRAYNYAARVARGDFLIFINSDMAFSPGWLDALIRSYRGDNCLAARLVESGKLASGTYGIERNFGTTPANYNESAFLSYVEALRDDSVRDGGLFMPLMVRKSHFDEVGGYPEGNIVPDSDLFAPTMAREGEPSLSGDNVLMRKLASKGIVQQTCFGSVVYHCQCGEKDDQGDTDSTGDKVEIAVCNDIVTGTMGERVLWDHLIDGLPGAYGVDKRLVGDNGAFESRARLYIREKHPRTAIVIQNATFIGIVDPERYTIAFLQDDLRSMQRDSTQQEANLRVADKVVTNSYQTSLSYPEVDCDVVPVGVDSDLFKPLNREEMRKKYGIGEGTVGIFVGSFSEVKGWSRVVECIEKNPSIAWIAVSKYDETYSAPNARVFNRIDQRMLAELLNCADFFIIGSPVETQCLAAIEACLCDIPVVMPVVGIFRDLSPGEREQLGVFGDDLEEGVKLVTKKEYAPRRLILGKGVSVSAAMQRWQKLIEDVVQSIRVSNYGGGHRRPDESKSWLYFKYRLELSIRKDVFKRLFGREHLGVRKYFSVWGVRTVGREFLSRTHLLGPVKRILHRK